MAIASLSFSAAVPVYNSIGSNGTIFGGSSVAVKGDVAINTNGAPASSGKSTVLTSDLLSNGLSYSPQGSFVSGNQLTVYYNLTGDSGTNPATDASAQQTLQAGAQGAALANGIYGQGVTVTPTGSQTNGDITTTAYQISINGPLDGVYGSVNQQSGYSISESTDGSSLSVQNIKALGNGLAVTYQLSDAAPSNANQPTPITTSSNTGLPPSLQGVTTLGDLLASASGLNFSGTLTGTLQAAQQTGGTSNTASALASVLSTSVNPNAGSSIQITDFIDTSSNAFPSAPATPSTSSSDSFNAQSNNDSSSNSSNNQGAAPSGVYTAFADVGASTIRGGSLNVVA